jgi:hypothetical protein
MDDYEPQFLSHYDRHFAGSNLGYQEIRSAYHFGAQGAKDSRFSHKDWTEAELTLQKDWEATHPEMRWNDVRDAVFNGWQVAHTATP